MPWLLGLCGVICSMGMAWLLHFFQPGENPMISQVPAQPSDAKFRSSPVIDSVLVRRQGAWSQGGKGRGQVKPHPRPACLQVGEVETHALLMRASKSITEEGLSGSDPGTQEGFSIPSSSLTLLQSIFLITKGSTSTPAPGCHMAAPRLPHDSDDGLQSHLFSSFLTHRAPSTLPFFTAPIAG